MQYVDYVEIENFKGLGSKVRISLGNPSVLIGPNNAGKTTVLQALSLWSRAVKAWVAKKGSGHQKAKRDAVGINRLLIMDIPVRETRYFWTATRIVANRKNVPFNITVGVRMEEGVVSPLTMLFTYRDPETLYSRPSDECMGAVQLLECAAKLNFNLLYPMSALTGGADGHVEEPMLTEGRINVYLGQGQTAQVLRNLCYKVWDASRDDWTHIVRMMNRKFAFSLREPYFDEARGAITLDYSQVDVAEPLELSLAGRGVQQMLLILVYLYSHKSSILMIDEPDAHLEILRQKQVYLVLKDAAEVNHCQILIATHSEVILDEAVETNLTCIVNGVVSDLSSASEVKTTLRSLGVQHYYKAMIAKRLLITEGSTDVEMLRAFAKKREHPAAKVLGERLFTYFTQTQESEESTDIAERVDRASMKDLNFHRYYSTLKGLVPDLQGVAFLDGDGKPHLPTRSNNGLSVVYWRRYELENYFMTPDRLERFVIAEIGKREGELFAVSDACRSDIREAMRDTLARHLFKGNTKQVEEFYSLTHEMQDTLLQNVKMSAFAEAFFERFAEIHHTSVLVNKGGYYRIIELMNPAEIDEEVVSALDLIAKTFSV